METKTFNFGKNETSEAINFVVNFCNSHCTLIDLELAEKLAWQVVCGHNDLYISKRSFAVVGWCEDNCLDWFDFKLSCRTNYFNGQKQIELTQNA